MSEKKQVAEKSVGDRALSDARNMLESSMNAGVMRDKRDSGWLKLSETRRRFICRQAGCEDMWDRKFSAIPKEFRMEIIGRAGNLYSMAKAIKDAISVSL